MTADVRVDRTYFAHISSVGTSWVSDFANHGRVYGKYGPPLMDPSLCDQMAALIDRFNVGKSEYGKLMDLVGREKGVFLHRLYGHHFVYDFPVGDPARSLDFLVHEFSDLFTKNGLPILPGELLENAPEWLRQLTIAREPCKSWNFINGFDLLAGTVAVFTACRDLRAAMMGQLSVDTLGDFAKTFGVGLFELAVSMSTANPLLLLGAILELTAGVRGIFNDGDVIHMQKQQYGLSLQFSLRNVSLEAALNALSVKQSLRQVSLNASLRDLSKWSFE